MRSLSLANCAAFLFAYVTTVYSQTIAIVPTSPSASFPACAVSCTVLLQIQSTCEPPNVAQANNLAYENCFCQSPSIQALYSTPDAICAGECTVEADRTLLQQWFLGFCKTVGSGIDPLSTAASSTVVTVTSTAGSTPTTTASKIPFVDDDTSTGIGWWNSHWKWIVVLIVLIIVIVGAAIFAVCMRRRYRRKHQQQTAVMNGFAAPNEKRFEGRPLASPDLWGPHQHMHATKGWDYPQQPANTYMTGGMPGNDRAARRESGRQRRESSKTRPTVSEREFSRTSPRRSSKGKSRAVTDPFDSTSRLDENRERRHSRRRRELSI